MSRQGVRAVPSLMYLERQTNFSIGADNAENESTDLAQRAAAGAQAPRPNKTAQATAEAAANLVPQGGLFWDGRADTLQDQAAGPLLNPLEMDGASSVEAVAARLRHTAYAPRFVQLFGTSVFDTPRMAVAEALFVRARWSDRGPGACIPTAASSTPGLKARPVSARPRCAAIWCSTIRCVAGVWWWCGRWWQRQHKANCGGCHLDRPTPDGLPPLFTDQQFEALGAPRNASLSVNDDAGYFDLGICGPYRTDMRDQTQYCGMFLTPTLRNVATRQVFFHNGVFHSLRAVLDFYNFRDVDPGRIYPRAADGSVEKLNDLPARYRANLDVADAPFDRAPGEAPPMSAGDEADLLAFLQTLTDGFELRAR